MFIILFSTQLSAQTRIDSFSTKLTNRKIKKERKVGIYAMGSKAMLLPIPILFYTPETKLAYGANAQLLFKFKNDTISPISSVGISAYYTLNKQLVIDPYWIFNFKQDDYRIAGAMLYRIYPLAYYGIGNNTLYSEKELYTPKIFMARNRMLRQVVNNFYIGVQYRFEYMMEITKKQGGLLDDPNVEGSDGYKASGFGLALLYDNRDNHFYPYKGWYVFFSNHNYQTWLGSDYNFYQFRIDARVYWNTFKSHVWAFQTWFDFHAKQPPFDMLAKMGGAFVMRGHFFGRFRDKHQAVFQSEYRFKIWWRFIGVGFAGIGTVLNKWSDFNARDLKYSLGMGLRFTLDPKERINIRIDYGFNFLKDESPIGGIYLQITEAF